MEESRVDSELKNRMADLEIMEVEEVNTGDDGDTEEQSENNKVQSMSRVLRKRKSLAQDVSTSNNRRVNMKPRKHTVITENANPKVIEALYLNKKVKNVSQSLETIYEEPKTGSEGPSSGSLIGGRKVKRLLTFHYQCTKDKIKKRRAKIKKFLGNKSYLNRKKISMKAFLETIDSLGLDDVTHTEMCPPLADK